jgi:glucose-6-phosphate dehydrogenase assembly protein OpcA
MAAPVSGKTTRPSEPGRIDADLAALWRDLGREASVARAAISNLVVYCHRPPEVPVDLAALLEVQVDAVAGRHPSRMIVLLHDREQTPPCASLAASVAILTFGPAQARYGVEQIVIGACSEASLSSIVRALTLGGLPTSVWWTDDFSDSGPPDATLATMGRQLVYDSRQWGSVQQGIAALTPLIENPDVPDFADLNWRRLSPLRQAVLHAIISAPPLDPQRFSQVRIRHAPGEAALAWLLAGWFEAQLPSVRFGLDVDEAAVQGEVLTAFLGIPDDPELTIALNEHTVVATLRGSVAPIVTGLPRESRADAVASTLRTLGRDVCLHRTLAVLMRRFSSI